jgi:hypothetical protein
MVIRFFKKSYLPQLATLILLAILWWLPQTVLLFEKTSSLTTKVADTVRAEQGAGLLLFVASAFLINAVATKHRLTDKNSFLTAFFFLLLVGTSGLLTQTTPFLTATFFFVLFYQKLFNLQNNAYLIPGAFDAGLFLGLAALFFPPLVLLLVYIWIVLIIYQTGQWRPYAAAVTGLILPWFFVFSGYYWFGNIAGFQHFFLQYFHFRGQGVFISRMDLIVLVLAGLITLAGTLGEAGRLSGYNISLRQHTAVNLWGMAFLTLLLLVFQVPFQALILLSPPAALVLGRRFSQPKKPKKAEMLILFWILLTFINQYLPVFHAS